MNNNKPCFLAGVCCLFYTVLSAQPQWPARAAIKDTGIAAHLPNEDLNNDPPPVYYQDKPAVLAVIDGDPSIIVDENLRMYRILNTPYLIIKNHHDNKFYLYGGRYWYVADSAKGEYSYLKAYPEVIKLIDSLVKQDQRTASKRKPALPVKDPGGRSPVIMSTIKSPVRPQIMTVNESAELIQTRGVPLYKKIDGTSLSYIQNTDNDIFRDSINQQFYILLSGRWYHSDALTGSWQFVASDKLPADFSRIPPGSEKVRVLYHVAGTDSAKRAVSDAYMLQATKVDRKTATASVTYDGGAEFSSISNTGLFVSENSNIPVINSRDKYYALQDGVWFKSDEAIGDSWTVSTERPPDIDKIPVDHRAYYTRFVYIYDTTENYVFTGYTSGYLNSYVQNNTVVWGTGWPYKSWYRRSYYPRPDTWGFSMQYQGADKGWIRRHGLPFYTEKKVLVTQ